MISCELLVSMELSNGITFIDFKRKTKLYKVGDWHLIKHIKTVENVQKVLQQN